MSENQDKLVVVTGGTKGIGRAIIEKFSEQGYTIATCARNEADLDLLKTEIQERFGNKVMIYTADVSKKDQVDGFVEFIRLTGKTVEVLVNNAGKFVPGQVHTEKEGMLEDQIETNLYSAYYVSKGFIPDMKKAGAGHIFNICSVASIMAYEHGGLYAISKHAMYGMSRSLREEMKAFGIRVTAVLPGATFTSSWSETDLPEDRFMPSEDIATMVYAAFSLSPRSVVEDIVIRPQLGDI